MEKINILIVEDELITATDLREILQKRGHHVVGIAKNYHETISILEKQNPDLALVDIVLKNSSHNGIEIAELLLQKRQIPHIFLTSHSDLHDFEEARTSAPKAYLSKPFRPNEIIFQIELTFEQHIRKLKTVLDPAVSEIFYIYHGQSYFKINKKEVIAIQAEGSYVNIYLKTQEKPLLLTITLKKISSYFQSPNFLRLSRKHLINLDYLLKFDTEKVWLEGVIDTISIPQNGRKELLNQLAIVKID